MRQQFLLALAGTMALILALAMALAAFGGVEARAAETKPSPKKGSMTSSRRWLPCARTSTI
ncbi:MAG TPA: hypothetical protein VIZ60_15515 [Rubrobacter sp.]|jgi:hypothetical protein